MIGGGAHSMIHPFGVTGFNRLTALSTANDNPRQRQPALRRRTAADSSSAKAPAWSSSKPWTMPKPAAQQILAEVVGYGSTADAFRITDQHPERRRRHRRHAAKPWPTRELTPTDIHYINAHGTGTRENDGNETIAIKTVFGDHAKNVPRQQHQKHDGPPDRRRRRGGIDHLRPGHPRQHAAAHR